MRMTNYPSPELDERAVRQLHAAGALDDNTATYWLLLLSAQARVAGSRSRSAT